MASAEKNDCSRQKHVGVSSSFQELTFNNHNETAPVVSACQARQQSRQAAHSRNQTSKPIKQIRINVSGKRYNRNAKQGPMTISPATITPVGVITHPSKTRVQIHSPQHITHEQQTTITSGSSLLKKPLRASHHSKSKSALRSSKNANLRSLCTIGQSLQHPPSYVPLNNILLKQKQI